MDFLFKLLHSNYPSGKYEDRLCWRLTSNGKIDVWSYYNALRRLTNASLEVHMGSSSTSKSCFLHVNYSFREKIKSEQSELGEDYRYLV